MSEAKAIEWVSDVRREGGARYMNVEVYLNGEKVKSCYACSPHAVACYVTEPRENSRMAVTAVRCVEACQCSPEIQAEDRVAGDEPMPHPRRVVRYGDVSLREKE